MAKSERRVTRDRFNRILMSGSVGGILALGGLTLFLVFVGAVGAGECMAVGQAGVSPDSSASPSAPSAPGFAGRAGSWNSTLPSSFKISRARNGLPALFLVSMRSLTSFASSFAASAEFLKMEVGTFSKASAAERRRRDDRARARGRTHGAAPGRRATGTRGRSRPARNRRPPGSTPQSTRRRTRTSADGPGSPRRGRAGRSRRTAKASVRDGGFAGPCEAGIGRRRRLRECRPGDERVTFGVPGGKTTDVACAQGTSGVFVPRRNPRSSLPEIRRSGYPVSAAAGRTRGFPA